MPIDIQTTYWEQKAIELEEAGQPDKAQWYRIRRPTGPGTTEFGEAEPLTIVSSEDARDDIPGTKERLDQLSGVGDEVAEGEEVEKQGIIFTRDDAGIITGMTWGTLPGVEEGEKTLEEMDPTERAFFETEKDKEEKDPNITALEGIITEWGDEITTLSGELDKIKISAEDASSDLIDSIKAKYDVRRQQMSDLYNRQKESTKVFGIRSGTSRYAPEMMKGVLSQVEATKIQELAVLDSEESSLIAQAKQDLSKEKWDMVVEQMDKIEKKRDEKIAKLEELNIAAAEANEKKAEATEKLKDTTSILALMNQGVNSMSDLFVALNYDAEGNLLDRNVSWDRIVEVSDDILKSQGVEGEEYIFNYTNADGYRVAVSELSDGTFKETRLGQAEIPGATGDKFEDSLKIRTTLRGEQIYKDVIEVNNGYQNVRTGFEADNAPGDLFIINGLAKILDPGSVIRPAEFDTVEQSQGFFSRFGMAFDKFMEGDRLSSEARGKFNEIVESVVAEKRKPLQSLIETFYLPLAQERGVSINDIIPREVYMGALKEDEGDEEGEQEISLEELATQKGWTEASLQSARDAGWTDKEILDYLNKQ